MMKSFSAVLITGMKYLWSNPANVVIVTFFPILLILLLGNALSAYISPETEFDPVPIAFVGSDTSMVAEFLNSEEISKFLSTEFITETQANQMLSEDEIALYITESGGKFSVTKPNVTNLNTSIALSVINSYNKISTAAEIAIKNGANPQDVFAKTNGEFSVSAMPIGGRAPTAMDYYAVTMLVYILLVAGGNGIELFGKSLLGEMGGRIMTAPVSKPALVGGLIGASTITSFLQGMITFVFTALVYGVYWGERIPLVLTTLFAVVLLSQAVAIFLVLLFKNIGPATGVLMSLSWMTTFVSKGYSKSSFGETADKIFAYAPNALAHTTIFGAIYGGNESKMMEGLLILFSVSAVLFIGAFFLGRRRFA